MASAPSYKHKQEPAYFEDPLYKLADYGILILDENKNIIQYSQWLVKKSYLEDEEIRYKNIHNIYPDLLNSRIDMAIDAAIHKKQSSYISQTLNKHPFSLYSSQTDFEAGIRLKQLITIKPYSFNGYCILQISDVTASAIRENALRKQYLENKSLKEQALVTLNSLSNAVISTNRSGHITSANNITETMTGWHKNKAIGQKLSTVISHVANYSDIEIDDTLQSCLNPINIESPGQSGCFIFISPDNNKNIYNFNMSPLKNESGDIFGAVVVFHNVTKSHNMAKKLGWQATHDSLTGLANRRRFEEKLSEVISTTKQEKSSHVLCYADLDQFKIVNDTCGHVAGDELLKQVATLLKSSLRSTDMLARLGGDEFGIILENCTIKVAAKIAEKLRTVVQDYKFSWDNKHFNVCISIGMAVINELNCEFKTLLSAADTACYAAKEAGRNQVHIYHEKKGDASKHHSEMKWATCINEAIEKDRFILYKQDIVSINNNNDISRCEILIRYKDKDGVIIPPGAFIPAAERFGMMPSVDRWVIKNTLKYIKENKSPFHQYNINLSGTSLNDTDFLDFVLSEINSSNIDAQLLCFEITETAAISNLNTACNFIARLKRVGCQFALDDFGSGLSSFSYLKNLPVDYLKIDGTFVKEITTDIVNRAMVTSINQIGHTMNLKTTAEFVENNEILEELKKIGVDYAQGYGISPPEPLYPQ